MAQGSLRLGGCTPGAPAPGRGAWQGPSCSGPGLSCLTCLLSTPPPAPNQSFHSSKVIIVIHIIIVIIIIASLAAPPPTFGEFFVDNQAFSQASSHQPSLICYLAFTSQIWGPAKICCLPGALGLGVLGAHPKVKTSPGGPAQGLPLQAVPPALGHSWRGARSPAWRSRSQLISGR